MKRNVIENIRKIRLIKIISIIRQLIRITNFKKVSNVNLYLERAFGIDKTIKKKDIDLYRKDRLIKLCRHAYKNCEYYKKIFSEADFNPKNLKNFKKLPVLDKEKIRKFEKTIVSKNLKFWQGYEFNSGGSTGDPLNFYLSPMSGIIDDLHQEFILKRIGCGNGDKIVTIGSGIISLDLRRRNVYWVTEDNNWAFGDKQYSTRYLDSTTIKYFVEDLIKTKPKIIRGYSSSIYDLAIFIEENKIKLPIEIKGIVLSGEQLFDWQSKIIRKVFNTDIYLLYGHSEAAVFAFTDKNSTSYICSPFYGLTEVLDKNNNHVHEGQIGEITVTGYYNYAMPFIRYKTGDIAKYEGTKEGIIYLDKLEGRVQNYIIDSRGKKHTLIGLFGHNFKPLEHIRKWQIVQNRRGLIVIKIIPNILFEHTDEKKIKDYFQKSLNIKIRFNYVDEIQPTKRGKHLFLIQKLKVY